MIFLIITASINNKVGVSDKLHRQKRYIDCIESLLLLIRDNERVHPVIVENNGLRHTFLDNLDCDILYTENNRFNFPHKGGNELLDIKDVIRKYNIGDDDVIIKLTGRYKIMNLEFINLVINNHDNIDAFVKFFNVCTLKYHKDLDDCVLGLYALKCKYLKNFEYSYKRSAECEFAIYVNEHVDKLLAINELNLECCFADDLRKLRV